MFIASERVVCPPRAGCPFHTTAKRYWMPEFTANQDDPDALTLILLHSTSFHKETWEPTLHQIFQRARRPGSDPTLLVLREAWALDCPNHGEAVQYNEDVLHEEEHAKEGFTCQKYAHAIHSFLSAGVNEGARVNFEKRRLVGIGHSLGANAILLAQQYEPRLPFSSIVIIEPMVSPKGVTHMKDLGRSLIENALRRRDVWGSREDAVTHFTKATDWDTRVIRLFAVSLQYGLFTREFAKFLNPVKEYGLRATTHHPGSGQHGVALACTREQEAVSPKVNYVFFKAEV
ncbi:hypothetical protein APHAL10511_008612 [Amanita phalloides]|nr:hypothetical protein APHAL10511_008612 [Amanita phalloides]